MKEIGLELECWLMRGDRIVEPARYGFPNDEFGFLIEIRGEPSSNPKVVRKSICKLANSFSWLAEREKLHLDYSPRKKLSRYEYFYKKYNHPKLIDNTANIYAGTSKSHHTGYISGIGTAGLHVHFSADGIQLPIFDIVRKMDKAFEKEIKDAKRIKGEFEIKNHNGKGGFEYRSLPCNVDIQKVIDVAFNLINKSRVDKTT